MGLVITEANGSYQKLWEAIKCQWETKRNPAIKLLKHAQRQQRTRQNERKIISSIQKSIQYLSFGLHSNKIKWSAKAPAQIKLYLGFFWTCKGVCGKCPHAWWCRKPRGQCSHPRKGPTLTGNRKAANQRRAACWSLGITDVCVHERERGTNYPSALTIMWENLCCRVYLWTGSWLTTPKDEKTIVEKDSKSHI